MSDCEDKSKCITDGELTLCGCFMVKQDELESQATRIAELESDIKEAMDAGYAQGVLATEGKAIARISELEQENASYFKQAQFYIVEKERAEESLKEQTRLGLACHDELAELKAKIRKMVAKW